MRITISLPDHLASRFFALVSSRERSATIARLLEQELAQRVAGSHLHAVVGAQVLAGDRPRPQQRALRRVLEHPRGQRGAERLEGVGGKRLVAFANTKLDHVDEAKLQELIAKKR